MIAKPRGLPSRRLGSTSRPLLLAACCSACNETLRSLSSAAFAACTRKALSDVILSHNVLQPKAAAFRIPERLPGSLGCACGVCIAQRIMTQCHSPFRSTALWNSVAFVSFLSGFEFVSEQPHLSRRMRTSHKTKARCKKMKVAQNFTTICTSTPFICILCKSCNG